MIKVLLAGDLMMGGNFGSLCEEGTCELDWPFFEIKKYFLESDIVFANFECPIITDINAENIRKDKSSILRCSKKILPILKDFNFKVLSIANNHIHDYGMEGVISTIKELKSENICPLGIYSEKDNVNNSHIINIKEKSVAFVAFSSNSPSVKSILAEDGQLGCILFTKDNINESVYALRDRCDLIIISMHWGFEKHKYPSPIQVDLAKHCIDQGADIVIGHHPHIVQGYQIYKDKYIFYSLGHLFFSDFEYRSETMHKWNKQNRLGLMVELTLEEKHTYSINLIPIFQNLDYRVNSLSSNEKETFNSNLNNISKRFDKSKSAYKRFWIRYHFTVIKQRLVSNISQAIKSNKLSYSKKIYRLFKVTIVFFIELTRRILYIEPGN